MCHYVNIHILAFVLSFVFHVLIGIQLYSNWLFIDLSVCIRLCRYVEVNMDSAAIVWPLFNSLQAFWPGLQVFSLFSFCLPCNMKVSYELVKLLWFGVICINDIERFQLGTLILQFERTKPSLVYGKDMVSLRRVLILLLSVFRYLNYHYLNPETIAFKLKLLVG